MPSTEEQKQEATNRLLAAEVEYLRASGWVPCAVDLIPPEELSEVLWRLGNFSPLLPHDLALALQKKKDEKIWRKR